MHYPRKIEDLMEVISSLGGWGEPLLPGLEGGQRTASWFLCVLGWGALLGVPGLRRGSQHTL
jgi:hypothetical protein